MIREDVRVLLSLGVDIVTLQQITTDEFIDVLIG